MANLYDIVNWKWIYLTTKYYEIKYEVNEYCRTCDSLIFSPFLKQWHQHLWYICQGSYLWGSMAKPGRTGHRSIFFLFLRGWNIMKAYNVVFHVNRTCSSHHMVIYTSHLCGYLEIKLMKTCKPKSKTDWLPQQLPVLNFEILFILKFLKIWRVTTPKLTKNQQKKKKKCHHQAGVCMFQTMALCSVPPGFTMPPYIFCYARGSEI